MPELKNMPEIPYTHFNWFEDARSQEKQLSLKEIKEQLWGFSEELENKLLQDERDQLREQVSQEIVNKLHAPEWIKILAGDTLSHLSALLNYSYKIQWYDWSVENMWDEADRIQVWDYIKITNTNVIRERKWEEPEIVWIVHKTEEDLKTKNQFSEETQAAGIRMSHRNSTLEQKNKKYNDLMKKWQNINDKKKRMWY